MHNHTWLSHSSRYTAGGLWGSSSPGHHLRPAGGIRVAVELGSVAAGGGGGFASRPPTWHGPLHRSPFSVWHPAESGVASQVHAAQSSLRHVQVWQWEAGFCHVVCPFTPGFGLFLHPSSILVWISVNQWAVPFSPILLSLWLSPAVGLRLYCPGGTLTWIPVGTLCAPWLLAGHTKHHTQRRWVTKHSVMTFWIKVPKTPCWSLWCVSVAGSLDAECVLPTRREQSDRRRGALSDCLPWWL